MENPKQNIHEQRQEHTKRIHPDQTVSHPGSCIITKSVNSS